MRSELGDRRLLIGGGAVIALLIFYLLFRGGGAEPGAPVVEPAPMPAPVAPVALVPVPAPAAPSASPQDLKLYGLTGMGAIIGPEGGGQRLIMVGREVSPGLLLAAVRIDHAVLRSSSGDYRLGFDGVTAAGAAPQAAGAPSGDAALREESLRYRLGLAPRREGDRIIGHVVRPGASLPALERAGLRAGDVLLRVNGSVFDQERLEELAWTLVNSDGVTLEIERDGRPMRLAASR